MTEVLAKTTAHSERRGNSTLQPEGRIGVRLHKGAFRGLGESPRETFRGQTLPLQNPELKWANPSEVQCWTAPAPEGIAGNTAPPPPFHPRRPHPPHFRPRGREGRFPPALRCPRGSRASLGAARRAGRRGRGEAFPAARAVPDPGVPAGLRAKCGRPQGGRLRNTPAKRGARTELPWGLPSPKIQKASVPAHPSAPLGLNPGRGGSPAAAPRARRGAGPALPGRPAPLSQGSALSAAVWAGEQPGVRGGSPAGWDRAPCGGRARRGSPDGSPGPAAAAALPRPAPPPHAGLLLPPAGRAGPGAAAAPGLPRAPPAAPGAAEPRRERPLSLAERGMPPSRTGTCAARTAPSPSSTENSCHGVSSPRSWGCWGTSVTLGAFLSVHRQHTSRWQCLAGKGIERTDRGLP